MRLPARLLVLPLAALALHAALASGTLAAVPAGVRVVLAALVLVLVPGHGWLAALRVTPPGGPWMGSGWALGLGVAWLALQILATRVFHAPFTLLAIGAALPGVLPWALAALARQYVPERPGREPRLGGLALTVIALAAALAVVHLVRTPTPVGFHTDSPDHIGTIRRMMASGDAFPTDAFFRDAGPAGADPRKGLWHPCVALIATLAHADPLDAWRALAALLAPLFVLNAAAFGFLVAGAAGAAVAGAALLLTYGGSLATQYLREAVFATKLADQLALATAAAVLADLESPATRRRMAAVGLALGAVATHVFAALQFGVVFGALGLGLLLRDRGAGPALRRLVVTSIALALPCLPYLAWRAQGAYAPSNVIHTEPQGLMVLWGSARVVDPSVLWQWFGLLWVVFPLSCWAWARAAARPAVLYLLTTTLAAAAILFFPPLVGLLQPRLGYLLMRFVWLMPLAGALAFALPALARAVGSGTPAGRVRAAVALVALLVLGAPAVLDGAAALASREPAMGSEAANDPLRWRDALAWVDAHLPAGSVVLSDPATCYAVPMLTRHWVTTLVDQHSSPNDSLALARIMDARDALDPYAPYARLRDVVRRWGATAIVLNDRFISVPPLDYWAPEHGWFVRARARLDAAPAAFRRVYDTSDFVVYAIEPSAMDTLADGGRARPSVRPATPAEVASARPAAPGLPEIASFALSASRVRAGDSLVAAIDWYARLPQPPGSYRVILRFDRDLPPGFAPPSWCAKPARKLLERYRRQLYRFRVNHLPEGGEYGVDLWRPDEIVRDSVPVAVPPWMAPGEYRVQAVMLRQPHYPVFRLSDYFFDHDYFSGLPVGTLRVDAASAAR